MCWPNCEPCQGQLSGIKRTVRFSKRGRAKTNQTSSNQMHSQFVFSEKQIRSAKSIQKEPIIAENNVLYLEKVRKTIFPLWI